MPKRLPVHGLDPAGGSAGQVPVIDPTGTKFIIGDAGGGGQLPVIDVVQDHGAAVDGTTDDTAAWQAAINAAAAAGGARIISSKPGISIIAGALQDTSGANSQLTLPNENYGGVQAITIVIEGPFPPSSVVAVGVSTPVPTNQLVLKSTLASGSGGALLAGTGAAGSVSFTNVDLYLRNVTFRMPANPTHTALNLLNVACVDLDNVIADAGSYSIPSISIPTTSTSYGIKLPDLNNGAHTRLGRVDVVGFYNGLLYNEHTLGQYVFTWACKVGHVFNGAAYHASTFVRMGYYHCQTGIKGIGGAHYVDIWQLNVEHAAAGTWVMTYDVDDASNYLHAYIRWHVVKAGVGVDTTFTTNGASNVALAQVGSAPPTGTSVIVQDEGSTLTSAATSMNFTGTGVTATSVGSVVTVNVPGATSTTGELLMQDSVTGPPVPVETEARDDWLYQG